MISSISNRCWLKKISSRKQSVHLINPQVFYRMNTSLWIYTFTYQQSWTNLNSLFQKMYAFPLKVFKHWELRRAEITTSAVRRRWFSGEESSDWRAVNFSWVRAHPITVWPLFAISRDKALPRPLLTPVISTVFADVTEFAAPLKGVAIVIVQR